MRRATWRLRLVLYLAAAVCGASVLGVLAPRDMLANWLEIRYGTDLEQYGSSEAGSTTNDMLQYRTRVSCAMSAFAAICFIALARRPMRHLQFVQLGAGGLMCTGAVALVAGVNAGLSTTGYVVDALVLLAMGLALFWYGRKPRKRRRKLGEGDAASEDSSTDDGADPEEESLAGAVSASRSSTGAAD